MIPGEYSFPRYLSAKKSVDDRALNQGVWQALQAAISARGDAPLRVLEIGAGVGVMVERMLEWGLCAGAWITAIDAEPVNIDAANRRFPDWARAHGFQVSWDERDRWILERGDRSAVVEFQAAEAVEFCQSRPAGSFDLLTAHAFLDLLDIPSALPALLAPLGEGGLFYFSLNFDGLTLLEPCLDPELDEQIQTLYHRTMDERLVRGRPSGDSRSGRHLFRHLKAAGADLLAAGASDWVVFPGPDGYPNDEAYFLHFILHTIEGALANHPELDSGRFAEWTAARQAQVERGELVYIAHQLDFAGRL